jgi:hypothetical protein
MPSRFDLPQQPKEPDPADAKVDTTKRYDVYCIEHGLRTVVHRNVLFKSMRSLFGTGDHFDIISQFIELEQPDGQTVFIGRHGLLRFCEHGTEPAIEVVSSK